MNKGKLKTAVHNYTDFVTMKAIGESWMAQVRGYTPIGDWIRTSALYWIGIEAAKTISIFGLTIHLDWIQFWMIIVFLAAKFYIMIGINWMFGKFMIKTQIPQEQTQYGSKTEYLSPYEKERRDTDIAICEALKIQHKYTNL
jgi:hypothetical protein